MLLRPSGNAVAGEGVMGEGEGRREALLQQLVRRFMLQARVPSSEWAAREGTLLRFSQSVLNRYHTIADATHDACLL